jgi:hypothetical protein
MQQVRQLLQHRQPFVFFWVFALGALASLHVLHIGRYWTEWMFGGRYSLMAVFVFFAGAVWLLRQGGRLRDVAVVLLVAGTVHGAVAAWGTGIGVWRGKPAYQGRAELIAWLNEACADARRKTIVTWAPLGRRLAPWTPRAAYHDLEVDDGMGSVNRVFAHSSADLIIVQRGERDNLPMDWEDFDTRFNPVARDVAGADIFRPREDGGLAEHGVPPSVGASEPP